MAEIIWSGDFETGNFKQWHLVNRNHDPNYGLVPPYGRPPDGGGDGSLLKIVTNPVRQGKYAAKFTVKNSINGSEKADCDPSPGTVQCSKRRTEVTMHWNLSDVYNALPYMSERWLSISHYIPSDWDSKNGSGWGVVLFQMKPRNCGGSSPTFAIELTNSGFVVRHRWHATEDPITSTNKASHVPVPHNSYYGATRPANNAVEGGFRIDFPDVTTSQAALADINKGGWTDWVVHTKFDARGPADNGTGFLRVWKRAGTGSWIQVLDIIPRVITSNTVDYQRGIMRNAPADGTNNGGFGIASGMYMEKSQVWGLAANRVIYNDNVKVGSEKANFEMMSPDGSSPTTIKLVNPPENLRINN